MVKEFFARGKLLISGEYLVLDGARALALPLTVGQLLVSSESDDDMIHWRSYKSVCERYELWNSSDFDLNLLPQNIDRYTGYVYNLLNGVLELKKNAFSSGINLDFYLDFGPELGLGSSSTLIYNLAKLFEICPFKLLEQVSVGSGYDIACAGADYPIIYGMADGSPNIERAKFNPSFKDNLYFAYLGKKVDTKDAINYYLNHLVPVNKLVEEVSLLTDEFVKSSDLMSFEKVMIEHEKLISKSLELDRIKDLRFKDYWGEIKSLGAWGGDFVLITSEENYFKTRSYFEGRGCSSFSCYQDLVYESKNPK